LVKQFDSSKIVIHRSVEHGTACIGNSGADGIGEEIARVFTVAYELAAIANKPAVPNFPLSQQCGRWQASDFNGHSHPE
jgi:hypothetical protein